MKLWLSAKNIPNCLLPVLFVFALSFATSIRADTDLPLSQVQYLTLPVKQYLDATVEAVNQATVSSQVSGRITDIYVDTDDYVTKGMLVMKLRNKEQQASVNAAKGNDEQAQADYARIKQLYEQQLVSKAELDKVEARLKTTKAALAQAQEALDNTEIRAPYSGIVVKRHVEAGEMAHVGQPLMTGLSLEQLRATVEVPQSLIQVVRQLKLARVLLAGNEQVIAADDITISPYADPKSHTFTMRLVLPAGDHGLYPGMFIKVVLITGEKPYLVIPAQAVVQRGDVAAVYVSDARQMLHLRQVRLGQK
ncbi:MAG: efflux RND transporter periplasmic adaptor subunit, partial [Gammaproteobacteria bacterium]|nr:efflux RND transporter periplasmic adaptor subunit [Gammaproteobacteria bacterium]